MRRAVCATPEVRLFLSSLGITEPDPVDDVIWNLLPKYQQEEVDVDDDTYAADIERIRAAFSTDSTAQKEKLRSALRDTNFVMVVDTGDGKTYIAKPGDIYIATDRLQQLFAGVPDILIVDNEYDCLRGEDIRDLLVACGAIRGEQDTVEIIDFKSEKKPDMEKDRDRLRQYQHQLEVYAHLVEERTGQKVSRMHLYYTGEDGLRQKKLDEATKSFTGFDIFNVNHYDVFRNPIQAKELMIEALEVQRLEFSTVFDGEKDGRMVKIMPVNRIATRADLNELIHNFDQKEWQRRHNEHPNRPVEKITLVCMGHEPDLAAQLELAAKPFKIDVEVVDILRDKADLEFKRDSQAKLTIKKGELVIEKFYPMNLLQKLSLQQESVIHVRSYA